MKMIGMLGGMSWESTAVYYELINKGIARELGGLHSAKIALSSVDFHDIDGLMVLGDWDEIARRLTALAKDINAIHADFLIITSNTIHKIADEIQAAINIPLLHIADATGEAIRSSGVTNVGLLGTSTTMEEDFLKGHLASTYNLNVNIPPAIQRERIHRIIFDELCQGLVSEASKQTLLVAVEELAAQGCEGVILGCTELPLLVTEADTAVPLYNTTELHSEAAVQFSLA